MFPRDDRPQSRTDRPRRRPDRIAVEGLEPRQLMAYSPFGYSLPKLDVTAFAAPVAAWGGTLSVDVSVQNEGASSLIEPLAIAPTTVNPDTGNVTVNTSHADAPATTVTVFASTKPNANSGLVQLGTVAIPSVSQNSLTQVVSTLTLPSRPKGFPSNGGKIFLTFVVDNTQSIVQETQAGNVFRDATPVKIVNPLPNLQVSAEDITSPLQPGDVIAPTIRIVNLGAGNPATQGTVTVQLVASLDKNFGPGDSVIASYTITSLPGLSTVPSASGVFGDVNLVPQDNVNTTTISPVKLPTSPGFYYLGIVIDPTNSIKMTQDPTPALMGVVNVGPPDGFLPSSSLLVNTNGVVPVFPALPYTVIGPAATTTTSPTLYAAGTNPSTETANSPVSYSLAVVKKKR